MRLSTRRCLLCISLLLTAGGLRAQASFPEKEGETVRYRAYIETRRGYVSGICLLRLEGGEVNGCLVNEFGILLYCFFAAVRPLSMRPVGGAGLK